MERNTPFQENNSDREDEYLFFDNAAQVVLKAFARVNLFWRRPAYLPAKICAAFSACQY